MVRSRMMNPKHCKKCGTEISSEMQAETRMCLSCYFAENSSHPSKLYTQAEMDSALAIAISNHPDMKLLDWLEDFLKGGHIESCFEMDGGIHILLSPVGGPQVAYRDQNTFREAITRHMELEKKQAST